MGAITRRTKHVRRHATLGPCVSTLVVLAFVLVLSAGNAFGSQPAVLTTPAQTARPVVAPAALMRATRLTHELRTLAAQSSMSRAQKSRLSRKIVAVSRAREAALLALLVRRPEAVGRLILPVSARHALARIKGAALESAVAVKGSYVWCHQDDFSEKTPDLDEDRLVSATGRVSRLYAITADAAAPLARASDRSDVHMAVQGFELGGRLLATSIAGVATVRTGAMTAAAATASTPTTGQQTIAVIAANFSDSSSPINMNAIRANFQGTPGYDVDSFFSESSYGKMTLAPSFYGPYTLPGPTATACSSDPTQALMSAANADVDFTQFKRLMFVVNCGGLTGSATGEGPVATPDGTITASVIDLDASAATTLYHVTHEISHTLGSGNGHAGFYVCLPQAFSPPTRFDSSCTTNEYGDLYDVLGGGPYQLVSQQDPFHKANAGWFSPGQFPTVTTPGTSTFTLAPYESPTSGVLALNIPRGNTGTAFTVEYRQPVGFDNWMGSMPGGICPGPCTMTEGASIRLYGSGSAAGGGMSDTQFIDTTPGSIASQYSTPFEDETDGALLPGHTFTDPEYGIQITVVSAGSSGLTVQVTIPAQTCTHVSPTLTPVLPLTQSGVAGQTVTYSATLTNNDSAGCLANTFRFNPPDSSAVKVVASPDYLKLAPGASATVSLAVTPQASTLAGAYSFSAIDGVGGGYFLSNTLGTNAAIAAGFTYQLTSGTDTTAPGSPPSLAAQALGSHAVKISWQPSSDNLGVAGYRVKSSNGYQYTTTNTTFIDTYAWPSTSYTYTVQAFDRKGNYSAAASVSVTTPARSDYTSPTAPVVTADAGDHTLTISWTASTDNTGVAYYQMLPCLAVTCVFPASARSVTVDGLTSQTRFDVRILAYDGDGNSNFMGGGYYTVYTAATGTTAPSQPKQLISRAGIYENVQLSWLPSTDDRGVVGYDVYRNARKIASVTGTSYTDTKVLGTSAYYVQAVDTDGSLSAPSTMLQAPAPLGASADTAAPTASIGSPASGEALSGMTTVTASASDNAVVSGVELYVDGVLQGASTAAPYTFSWDTTKLSDGPHWLYVRAYDGVGNYGTAGVTNVTVNNAGGGTPPPPSVSPPTSLTAEFGHSIDLSWTAPVGTTVSHYVVERDGAQIGTTTNTYYYDDTVSPGGTYSYDVRAVDATGNVSDPSNVATASVPETSTPNVPFLSVAAGSKAAALTWSAPATGGSAITGYRIYRGTTSGGETLFKSLGLVTSYADTRLTNGTTYYYEVSAVTSTGEGGRSGEVAATPASAPSAPSVSTPANGAAGIVLTWSASVNGGSPVTAYNIYRGTASNGETLLATVGNVTTYTDTAVTAGTKYYYKLSAVNAVGTSALSSEKSVVRTVPAPPSAPRSLAASTGRTSGVALKWSSPASTGGATVTGYMIYRATASGSEVLLATVGNVTSYNDTATVPGTVYYYVVTAVNAVGESPQSNESFAAAR